jgi:hypothetical protein
LINNNYGLLCGDNLPPDERIKIVMEILNKAVGLLKSLTSLSISLLALGVVLQVLFGATVPFIEVDVVGSVVDVTKQLGSEGLVGLVALWVLVATLDKNSE